MGVGPRPRWTGGRRGRRVDGSDGRTKTDGRPCRTPPMTHQPTPQLISNANTYPLLHESYSPPSLSNLMQHCLLRVIRPLQYVTRKANNLVNQLRVARRNGQVRFHATQLTAGLSSLMKRAVAWRCVSLFRRNRNRNREGVRSSSCAESLEVSTI